MLQHMLALPSPLAAQPQGKAYQRALEAALDDARVKVRLGVQPPRAPRLLLPPARRHPY
jgi:hypothetical protein